MLALASTMDGRGGAMSSTLWTATLMEMLLDGLSNERSDREILSTVDSLYAIDLDTGYLLDKVRNDLGVMHMLRLKVLIALAY